MVNQIPYISQYIFRLTSLACLCVSLCLPTQDEDMV